MISNFSRYRLVSAKVRKNARNAKFINYDSLMLCAFFALVANFSGGNVQGLREKVVTLHAIQKRGSDY
jgi:hypothetical protein